MTKIAFVGKGGSGKTTLASLFSHYLCQQKCPVLALDADINQHLGEALGLSAGEAAQVPPLGLEIERVKAYVRGDNPRIASEQTMIKTTPPGHGSRLLGVREQNPLYEHFARDVQGIRLMVTGPFSQEDLGLKCYHAKVGAVELLLNHCADGQDEYVIVDMTAGADSFASGLFTRFDLTFVVVEPTRKSVSVYQQYKAYAQPYQVRLCVIGNKVEQEEDLAFLRAEVGEDLLTWLTSSLYIKARERGQDQSCKQLESANEQALAVMQKVADGCVKDWERYYRQAVMFHQKNAVSWANAQIGEDLTAQIDPAFDPIAYADYANHLAQTLSSVSLPPCTRLAEVSGA